MAHDGHEEKAGLGLARPKSLTAEQSKYHIKAVCESTQRSFG